MKKLLSFIFAAGLVSTAAISVSAAYDLTEYDLPSNGVHFSFDGTCTDDSGELVGEAQGTIVSVEGRDGTANGAAYFDTADDHIRLMKKDF